MSVNPPENSIPKFPLDLGLNVAHNLFLTKKISLAINLSKQFCYLYFLLMLQIFLNPTWDWQS